jgi:MoaA/NifB/PqqE/SkfB family radical SAM enzyme
MSSFITSHVNLAKLAWRAITEVSLKSNIKAAWLYGIKGGIAIKAHRKRQKKGELYPPFIYIDLTNTCNLRCKGCWVEKEGEVRNIPLEDIKTIIEHSKKNKSYFHTLLGGEPFMYKDIWTIFEDNTDCYFQVITNGMMFTEDNVKTISRLGNITPLISIDGFSDNNNDRRGKEVFESAMKGIDRLRKNKILFGIATTITANNFEEVFSPEYLNHFINKGALYIWYYVYRPVGNEPNPHLCLTKEQIVEVRKKLLEVRRKYPILIIDSYWTAEGEAFCPAAIGLGYHVGPKSSIEICPPLSFAVEHISDNKGDLTKTFNESHFLKDFQTFVKDRTKGCVILEHPQELANYIENKGAKDFSTRDAYKELREITPRHSQHLPGSEIPEDFWFYKMLKKQAYMSMDA